MLKKLLLLLVCLSISSPIGAIDFSHSPAKLSKDFTPPDLTRPFGGEYNFGLEKGLLFYANYEGGTINPSQHRGLGTATFLASRSATNPATYIDSNGIVQLTTTSNVPRYAGGYYDSTGFHTVDSNGRSAKGLMIEAAGTNRATQSSVPEEAAWTKTNITADNDDTGSSSPDGTATAPRLLATAGNGTFTQAYVDASAGIYTASLYIKRKTGTGVINLRANTGNAYTAITTSVLTTTWTRVSVSSTSLTNPTFDLQLVTDTDAVYIWGCQLEKNPYMTSLIPCAASALTRNAETLKFEIAGNRRADEETIAIKIMPFYGPVNNITRIITNTDTKNRYMSQNSGTTDVRWRPNGTDSTSCQAPTVGTAGLFVANTSCVLVGTCQHSSPYASLYRNGSLFGLSDTSDDFINPAWGTYFYLGSESGGTNQLSGLIQEIGIWERALSASEGSDVTNLLNGN